MKKFKANINKSKDKDIDEDSMSVIVTILAFVGLIIVNVWFLSKLISINNIIQNCISVTKTF